MLRRWWDVVDEVHKLVEVLKGTVTLVVRVHSPGHVTQDGDVDGAGSGYPGRVVCPSKQTSLI